MAFRFGKKKPTGGESDQEGNGAPPFEPQPDKAREWFEHARRAAESSQFAYALHNYANGIKLDPAEIFAHKRMFEAAMKYAGGGGKPATGNEIRKVDGAHPVARFAAAEFAWMMDLNNPSLALKYLEATLKSAEWTAEIGRWHALRVVNVLRGQKKPSKSSFLQAKDLLVDLGAWDEALVAGQGALDLDLNDSALEGELKDISAQRAMDQAGYAEAGGVEGGFRKFVKDIDKQRELEEAGAIAGGMSIDQRNLQRARKEYEESGDVPDVINLYAQLLKAQSTPEAEEQAHEVAMKGYRETKQYRFRVFAGDIRIEQAQRNVSSLLEKLEQGTGNAELKSSYEEARGQLLDLQHAEYTERVREYPTNRFIKQQLGEVEFIRCEYHEAMKCFQVAKDEPKVRVKAGYMLGRCFAAERWHKEAIDEYKEALERVEPGDRDAELAIRYDLMVSLMEHARDETSLSLATESLAICSSIARKDITYRDIRECRKKLDELVRQLKDKESEA